MYAHVRVTLHNRIEIRNRSLNIESAESNIAETARNVVCTMLAINQHRREQEYEEV
jgi:hypothetical protein